MALANNKIIRSAGAVHHAGQRTDVQPEQPAVGLRFGHSGNRRSLRSRGVEAALSDFDATWTTTFNIGQNSDDSEQRRAGRRSARRPGARPIHRGRTTRPCQKRSPTAVRCPLSNVVELRRRRTSPCCSRPRTPATSRRSTRSPCGPAPEPSSRESRRRSDRGFPASAASARALRLPASTKTSPWERSSCRPSTLLRDTENTYWNLYLQYRLYHTAVVAHNSALRSWREAYAKLKAGGVTGFTPGGRSHGPRPALQHAGDRRADPEQPLHERNGSAPLAGSAGQRRSNHSTGRRAADGQASFPTGTTA